ncbi:871_t:CDS:2, partial [Ambispora leptoticha]
LTPGITYYITMWYKRQEQGFRMGLILSSTSLGGAFSGLLAYAIASLTDEDSPLKGWQLIFLIDGLVSIIVAIIAYIYITDYPDEAKWLNQEERSLAVLRLKLDDDDEDYKKAREHSFDKVYVLECLKDWKVYISMLILLGITTTIYSFVFFVPSIVNGIVISQLLVAPPFLFGFISQLVVTALSDRTNLRGPFVMSFASIGVVGYIVILYSVNLRAMFGVAPCSAIAIVWLSNNLSPPLKRNIGVAMMISCANCGGIIAAQIYRSVDYPNYVRGHIFASGFLLAVVCLSAIQYGMLGRLNELKEKEKISHKTSDHKSIKEDKKELAKLDFTYNDTSSKRQHTLLPRLHQNTKSGPSSLPPIKNSMTSSHQNNNNNQLVQTGFNNIQTETTGKNNNTTIIFYNNSPNITILGNTSYTNNNNNNTAMPQTNTNNATTRNIDNATTTNPEVSTDTQHNNHMETDTAFTISA